ncbi:hypothetical protein [Pararobbsia silviterrae]|uniref:Uncharacterized protein n=1 Tax=Pararobbsia silviterrae TaxID=1792498 RepID=A0A494Y0U2_9BURK|nr:hypothetical protein [Pararobbsia silviterrae]RKP56384.1 hypothetical protein D7S86_08280 [Pararobbsia silviterrae]
MDELTLTALHAHLQAYYALVRALHEAGVLPVSAVVNQLGDRADFGKTQFSESENPVSRVIYDGLFELEQQYEKSRPFRPAPGLRDGT